MATPVLAGHVGMIRQYFMEGFYPSGSRMLTNAFTPSGSLLKATAIAGAVNMAGVKTSTSTVRTNNQACTVAQGTKRAVQKRPYFDQGFGRTQLDQVLYFNDVAGSRFLHIASLTNNLTSQFDTALANGQTLVYKYCAYPDANNNEIRIVLTWTDPPSSLAASKNLVNDLDLTVSFKGNSILGNSQSNMFNALSITRDNLNNVESVYLAAVGPTEGRQDVEVRVQGTAVPMSPQLFSLVLTGNLAAGACSDSLVAGPSSMPLTVGIQGYGNSATSADMIGIICIALISLMILNLS
jgi:hypothetical protein